MRRVGYPQIRRRGRATTPNLSFPAPRGTSGAYLLSLRAGRQTTTVPFLVQSQDKAKILVVVPAISWLGTDRVDDPPFDGLANTLTRRRHGALAARARRPRRATRRVRRPGGAAARVPRPRTASAMTSRATSTSTSRPARGRATARPSCWPARGTGSRARWPGACATTSQDGGKLAYFGEDTLRRGVTLSLRDQGDAGTLSRPTQPTATDAFGARIATRTATPPATLTQIDGDSRYGLMTGVPDGLPGFTDLEESLKPLPPHAKLLAGVGEALTDAEVADAEQTGKPARELRPGAHRRAARQGAGHPRRPVAVDAEAARPRRWPR